MLSVNLHPSIKEHAYFTDGTRLYMITEIIEDSVIMENCQTEKLRKLSKDKLMQKFLPVEVVVE